MANLVSGEADLRIWRIYFNSHYIIKMIELQMREDGLQMEHL